MSVALWLLGAFVSWFHMAMMETARHKSKPDTPGRGVYALLEMVFMLMLCACAFMAGRASL